jgi:hypothetical protein
VFNIPGLACVWGFAGKFLSWQAIGCNHGGLGCVLVMGREEEKKATRVHIGKPCSNLNLGNDRRWHCWSVGVLECACETAHYHSTAEASSVSGQGHGKQCWLSQPLPTPSGTQKRDAARRNISWNEQPISAGRPMTHLDLSLPLLFSYR